MCCLCLALRCSIRSLDVAMNSLFRELRRWTKTALPSSRACTPSYQLPTRSSLTQSPGLCALFVEERAERWLNPEHDTSEPRRRLSCRPGDLTCTAPAASSANTPPSSPSGSSGSPADSYDARASSTPFVFSVDETSLSSTCPPSWKKVESSRSPTRSAPSSCGVYRPAVGGSLRPLHARELSMRYLDSDSAVEQGNSHRRHLCFIA